MKATFCMFYSSFFYFFFLYLNSFQNISSLIFRMSVYQPKIRLLKLYVQISDVFCCFSLLLLFFFFVRRNFFTIRNFQSASAIRKYPVLILQTSDTRVISKGLRWMKSPHQNAKPVNQQGFPLVLSLSSHRFKIQLIPFLRAGKRNRIYTSVA